MEKSTKIKNTEIGIYFIPDLMISFHISLRYFVISLFGIGIWVIRDGGL